MMNPTPPILSGALLVAMIAAGTSHYWTVREVIANYPTTPTITPSPLETTTPPIKQTTPQAPQATPSPHQPTPPPLARGSEEEREFYASLLAEMRALRNENKNLTDQIGETNRDIMKMEFRMDTYSESFRPLPIQERLDDTTFGPDPDFPGVLPPRATPVNEFQE